MGKYEGMRWYKCDLHVQTPQEHHWRDVATKVTQADTEGRKVEIARTYLRRCHEVGLEVIGITDHNLATRAQDSFIHFLRQENRFVAGELHREMIHILPGFEITADVGTGVHVLAIFDRDISEEGPPVSTRKVVGSGLEGWATVDSHRKCEHHP